MPHCETLGNGLRVVLVPCEAESVAVGLFVASGSRHETAKMAGISHFVEHMLFKGTPNRSQLEITRAIEGRGGNFNACTGEESTCYYAHLPSECLDEAVDILSDMYLNATIDDDEFEREKAVIVEEIRMYADEPDQVALENLQAALFPRSRLGAPVAGTPKSLAPMRPGDLRRHIATHYLPGNTVAVIVGAFEEERALANVRKTLGGFRRRAGRFVKDDPCACRPMNEVSVGKDVNQAQMALGYRTFGIRDRRKYAATVMDAVLGRGMSSRLFQEVREKRGLSYDISSRMQFFGDAGMFVIAAGLDAGKMESTVTTVRKELERVCERPVSAAELRRTKDFLIGNFRLGHEKIISKLFFFGQTMLSFGRLVSPAEQIEGVRNVTSAEVQATAQAILRRGNACLSKVMPARDRGDGR